MPLIDPNEVTRLFLECLFKDEEVKNTPLLSNAICIHGINLNIGLHEGRLNERKQRINEILDLLPRQFTEGWSFLNMCNDKSGEQWTGLHSVMQELMLLGIATKKLEYCIADRDIWNSLPGGVPYVILK